MSGMSLMKMMNRSGPRMLPCGYIYTHENREEI